MEQALCLTSLVKSKKFTECLKLLESKNCNVNEIDYLGKTVLHYACKMGNVLLVQTLIDKGARICITDFNHRNAFHEAVSYRKWDIVEFFIDNYGHLELVNDFKLVFLEKLRPIYIMVRMAPISLLESFLTKVRLPENDLPLLNEACKRAPNKGRDEAIRLLLERGAKRISSCFRNIIKRVRLWMKLEYFCILMLVLDPQKYKNTLWGPRGDFYFDRAIWRIVCKFNTNQIEIFRQV